MAALALASTASGLFAARRGWGRVGLLVVPLGVGLGLTVAVWVPGTGLTPGVIPGALELTGAAAALMGAIQLAAARVEGPLRIVGRPGRGKVRVLRDGNKPAAVPATAVGVGQHLALAPGEALPLDVRVVDGEGFVSWAEFGGPKALAVGPGDVLPAGTVPRKEGLVGQILAPIERSYLTFRSEQLDRMRAFGFRPDGFERVLGAVQMLLAAAGAGALAWFRPDLPLGAFAAVLLAGAPAAAWLAGIRSRAATTEDAFRNGTWFVRPRDLWRFFRARRFFVDPVLLAAQGKVEALVLGDADADAIIRLAEASVPDGPERVSLTQARAATGWDRSAAAAVKEADGVTYATVEGQRIMVGTPSAMEAGAGISVPRDQSTALEFLASQGMQVWLVASSAGGLLGALGIRVAARDEVLRAGQGLQARLLPGLRDASRKALAQASQLSDGGTLRAHDVSILSWDTEPPSAGLRMRVLELRHVPRYAEGQSARVWAHCLPGLPGLVQRARRRRRLARTLGACAAVGGVSGAAAVVYFVGFQPALVATVALLAFGLSVSGPGRELESSPAGPPPVPQEP